MWLEFLNQYWSKQNAQSLFQFILFIHITQSEFHVFDSFWCHCGNETVFLCAIFLFSQREENTPPMDEPHIDLNWKNVVVFLSFDMHASWRVYAIYVQISFYAVSLRSGESHSYAINDKNKANDKNHFHMHKNSTVNHFQTKRIVGYNRWIY